MATVAPKCFYNRGIPAEFQHFYRIICQTIDFSSPRQEPCYTFLSASVNSLFRGSLGELHDHWASFSRRYRTSNPTWPRASEGTVCIVPHAWLIKAKLTREQQTLAKLLQISVRETSTMMHLIQFALLG